MGKKSFKGLYTHDCIEPCLHGWGLSELIQLLILNTSFLFCDISGYYDWIRTYRLGSDQRSRSWQPFNAEGE